MVISKKPLTETKVLFKNNTTQLSAFIMMGASHSAENGLYNFLLISTQGGGGCCSWPSICIQAASWGALCPPLCLLLDASS